MSRPSLPSALVAIAAAAGRGAPARCRTLHPAEECFRRAMRASEHARASGCFAFATTGAKLEQDLAASFSQHAHRWRREVLADGLIPSIAWQHATAVPGSANAQWDWDQATSASTCALALQRLGGAQRFVFQFRAFSDPETCSFYVQTTTSPSHTSADALREQRTGEATRWGRMQKCETRSRAQVTRCAHTQVKSSQVQLSSD